MKLVKCDKEDCHNITTAQVPQYGTFCFAHSTMTYKPRVLIKKERELPVLSPSLMVFNSESKFVALKSSKRMVKSSIRKIPQPIKLEKILDSKYDIIPCGYCEDFGSIKYTMKCGHYICSDCLSLIRISLCPICEQFIEGELVSEEILSDIIEREREDMK
jgi:hypothetical protein